MRPVSDVEFYADVLCSGTVLGLDAHSTPEQVTAVLGTDLGEYRTRGAMIWDFGLIEFTWERRRADRTWRGAGFAVQVHRLETAGAEAVSPAIRAAYGTFPSAPPRLEELRALMDAERWPLRDVPGADPDFRELWQPESGVSVLTGPRRNILSSGTDDLPVYRIGAPLTVGQAVVRSQGFASRSPALDRLDHLLGATPEERLDWLARRGSAPEAGRTNWWLYHLQVIDFRIAQQAENQGTWIELKLWLLDKDATVCAPLSESIIGSGTLTAWRAALQTESALGEIFKGSLFQTPTVSIWATDDFRKGLGATVRSQVHLTDWLVRADDGRSLLSAVSTSPLLRYRDYLGDLGVTPTRFELDATLHSGLGVNGLLGADALSSEDVQDDVDLETELADRVEELLLTPKQAGRLAVLEDLRSALARVDGTVVEMLEGGWAVVHEAPPAAAEMAAHCAVEAIDRALRAASPDAEVESWLPTSGRPEKEWYSTNRRLTRAMRIRYIMHGHKSEAGMASLMTDSLIALQKKTSDQAQAIKHASAGDLSKARGLLTTAESILTLIFLTT